MNVRINKINDSNFYVDRDDGAQFQIVADLKVPGEFYLDKVGEADIIGYFPSVEAAIEAAKEA